MLYDKILSMWYLIIKNDEYNMKLLYKIDNQVKL